MHYVVAWNIDCSRFRGKIREKYFICRLIINKAHPNLYSGDTFLGPEDVPWIEVLLHCALVRPKLEYSSSMWSPYITKHRALIENVQRGKTKYILNYPSNMSCKETPIKLNLLPLEIRRETSDLLLFFKSINVLYSLTLESFCARSSQDTEHGNMTLFIFEHNPDRKSTSLGLPSYGTLYYANSISSSQQFVQNVQN